MHQTVHELLDRESRQKIDADTFLKLHNLQLAYYDFSRGEVMTDKLKAYLLERLPEIKELLADTLEKWKSRGFKVATEEEMSLSKVRKHAEKYMGKLRSAALAEAALDNVQIDADDAIKLSH